MSQATVRGGFVWVVFARPPVYLACVFGPTLGVGGLFGGDAGTLAFVASAGLLVIRSRRVRVDISSDRVQVVNLFLSHRLTPPVKILAPRSLPSSSNGFYCMRLRSSDPGSKPVFVLAALKGSNAELIEVELRARRLLA